MGWLQQKKFKYTIMYGISEPLHGIYYLTFENKEEEMITRLAWGLVDA
jgi:hypothetical protein